MCFCEYLHAVHIYYTDVHVSAMIIILAALLAYEYWGNELQGVDIISMNVFL